MGRTGLTGSAGAGGAGGAGGVGGTRCAGDEPAAGAWFRHREHGAPRRRGAGGGNGPRSRPWGNPAPACGPVRRKVTIRLSGPVPDRSASASTPR
ncbi:hypothetical protein E0L36_22355 [Streptomyces sp. AJS327]|nr:hypothetical protein [Streptomyces sp. AJS327]